MQNKKERRKTGSKRGRRTRISAFGMSLIALAVIFAFGAIFAFALSRRAKSDDEITARSDAADSEETAEQQTQIVVLPEELIPEDAGRTTEQSGAEATWTVEQARIAMNAQELLEDMTLEEKVAQLFFVTPEAITGYSQVTRCGDVMRAALDLYPVGGLIFLAQNLETPEQTKEMLEGIRTHMNEETGLPVFLGVDEEGGRVLRIGNNAAFGVPSTDAMLEIAKGGERAVYDAADEIGAYLNDLGFNVDFAPVADVLTNPENDVIGDRAFGSDPQEVADMARQYANALRANGILATYKHFPGHGDTYEDSHDDSAYSNKTLDELREAELIPFIDGAGNDAPFIMVAHITLPNVTEGSVPATLSDEIVTDLLREEIGYQGIVITDSLNMGAISNHYTTAESAVQAIQAGCDMLLMADNFQAAYNAVLGAVRDGTIKEERVDASVQRILERKLRME